MFQANAFSSLTKKTVNSKNIYIVDRHQYVLPIWAYHSLLLDTPFNLVSIDYHPDTQPPFWQQSYYKAIQQNGGDVLCEQIINRRLEAICRESINQIIDLTEDLNNDEHIRTALALDYINEYHMINCMDQHILPGGTHYLLPKKYFGCIDDDMFHAINFEIPKGPFILDIDLDFFLIKHALIPNKQQQIIKKLIQQANFITIARSHKYFDYLSADDFSLADCEKRCLQLCKKYILNH